VFITLNIQCHGSASLPIVVEGDLAVLLQYRLSAGPVGCDENANKEQHHRHHPVMPEPAGK